VGDFHVPDRFGRVTFVAPTAQVAPTGEQPALVAPSVPSDNTAVPVVRTLRPELADSVRQQLPNLRGRVPTAGDEQMRREQNQRQGNEPIVGSPE
jgi:hypothetical protein